MLTFFFFIAHLEDFKFEFDTIRLRFERQEVRPIVKRVVHITQLSLTAALSVTG